MKNCFKLIYSDYRRYKANGERYSFIIIFFTQGFWATMNFRVSNSLIRSISPGFFRKIIQGILLINHKLIEIITGINIPNVTSVKRGLYIGHYGQIIINSEAQIGENCNLSQGVTIGEKIGGKRPGVPIIKDRVYIGPNAIIFGGITIENDASIGAGCVVNRDIPTKAVVVGNPCRIISFKGSFNQILYDGMEYDESRRSSLAATSDF